MAIFWMGLTLAVWVVGYWSYNRAIARELTKPSLGFWLAIALVDYALLASVVYCGGRGTNLTAVLIWTAGATVTLLHILTRDRRLILNLCERVCLVLVGVSLAI